MQSNGPVRRRFFEALVPLLAVLACLAPTPALADLTVMKLANDGVLLSAGETRVMVDGLVVEPYAVYGGLPAEVIPSFEQAAGPFEGVDLALSTHRHHDHNQPLFACRFLQASRDTLFVSAPQVTDLMREKCREFMTGNPQIRIISPQYGEPVIFEKGGARVSAYLLSHGTGKYARLQHYGFLVELGGMKILHIGDAAMNPADFATAGFDQMDIDVALIPFWFFQPGPGADVVERYMDATYKIAIHIPPSELEEVSEYMKADFPRVMILPNVLDQARFSASAPPFESSARPSKCTAHPVSVPGCPEVADEHSAP